MSPAVTTPASVGMVDTATEPTVPRSEKRRLERTRTDQLLYVELGTGNGGIVLDLSEEGCGFLSIAPIWDKEPHFSFAIGGGRRIQGDGKVVWVDQSKKLGGLRFSDASPKLREQVRAWLAEPKIEAPQPEAKTQPDAPDILQPIESRPVKVPAGSQLDSSAKQRRKQLREDARAKMEAAQRGETPAEESDSAATKRQPEVHDSMILHAPGQFVWPEFLKRRAIWNGAVVVAVAAAMMLVATLYRERAGAALMRLGTRLAGKEAQITPPAESTASAATAASAEPKQEPAESKPIAYDAAGGKGDRIDAAKSSESANQVRQAEIASTEATAVSAEAPQALSKGIERNSAPPVVQKVSPAAIQKPTSTERRQTNAATLKSASTPAMEPRKREPRHATAEQVQALWSEVEGGDVSAAVMLGELYARGNGVPKSCGQARMLLNSAAKKGSDEARQKLEQLGDAGCP